MKKLKVISIFFFSLVFVFAACDDKDKEPEVNAEYQYVNDWIYEQMAIYYLWNDKISSKPDYSLDPTNFFNSILYKYNATGNPNGDRFSWIQESYVDLLNDLGGVSSEEIGFEYIFVRANEAGTQYYAMVLYPKLGTDAYSKGINRGRFITKINGNNITSQNYSTLLGGTGTKTLSMADWVLNSSTGSYQLTNSGDVVVNMHANYAENPVYYDNVYTVNDTKIGYLVYNFFATDKGDGTYSYDQDLIDALNRIKNQGATEMVLDLRYNTGGAVSTAVALSSALVNNRSTNNALIIREYNSLITDAYTKTYGADYFKTYFIDKIQKSTTSSISIPAMNFQHLYVLTSSWTASASELVINGLKPYMDVTLIGETTYGKNVGSSTFYEENDAKNKWGMQPIIVKMNNSLNQSDFTAGFTPDYEIDEFEDLYLYNFGETEDPLLGKAISLITGTSETRSKTVSTPFRSSQIDKRENTIRLMEKGRFEMYDDVKGETIKSLMQENE